MSIVQLPLPWDSAGPPATRALDVGGRRYGIQVARHRRARRYVLRVVDADTLRLTVPRGASIAGGLRFVERQAAWIDRERLRQQARREPWRVGTDVWFRGERVALRLEAGDIACGPERVALDVAGRDVRDAVEGHLRDLAGRELPVRCAELAASCGVVVSRVVVRNQRSRWGACTPSGLITLNWRLVQMPIQVRDYVVFHELMHRRQPNHSRRFWREVASVCSWWQDAERWLRRYGKELI